jgi:hypothetical protein
VLSDLLQVLRLITRRSARRIAQSSCAPSQSQIEFRASLTLLQVHVPPPPWKPLAAMTSSRRMLAADDDDDGEEGLGRVVDALMCHMWPGMIRKTPAFGGSTAAAKAVPATASAPVPASTAAAGSAASERAAASAAEGTAHKLDAEDDMGHFTTDEDDDAFSRFRMTIRLFFVACNFLRISFIRLVAEARRVRENGGI